MTIQYYLAPWVAAYEVGDGRSTLCCHISSYDALIVLADVPPQ